MSSTLDRIVDLIDVGLQTPMPDPSFGEVSPRVEAGCVRCQRDVDDDADLCPDCRAFLLGDTDADPALPPVRTIGGLIEAAADFEEVMQRVRSVFAETSTRIADLWFTLSDEVHFDFVTDPPDRLPDLLHGITIERPPVDLAQRRHGHAALCPRHGPTRGGTCLRCR